jgi:two-component system nitrogen regulation response regulator NtrX
MPPLRERREDVPLLVSYYQRYFSGRYGIQEKEFTPDSIEILKKYSWPGNVRELRNIIERIYIMYTVRKIDGKVIESLIMLKPPGKSEMLEIPGLKEAMENFEKHYIIRRLRYCDGSIGKTASALGIERTSLYRKMKKHKINGLKNEEQ